MVDFPGTPGPDNLGPGPANSNDSITGIGANDSLFGGGGNDTIFGGDDNDSMFGGSDDDSLFGDAGDDSLFGGNGSDLLNGGAGADSIAGGGGGGRDTVSYAGSTGPVSVSVNGTGSGFDAQGDNLTEIEDLFGSGFGDTINGDGSANRLQGEDGNDFLYGRDGNDSLYGGIGSDVTYGASGSDTMEGGEGDDRLYGGIGTDRLVGDAGADQLFGGDGNDALLGGDGNDTLLGGLGNDSLIGGGGTDAASYANSSGAVSVNLVSSLSGGAAGTDTLSQIEDVFGGYGADSITGDSVNNRLVGGAGNDSIFAGDGNDTVEGGLGNDSLQGGAGTDTWSFRGANTGFNSGTGVNANLATGSATGEGTDTATGFENLIGSSFNDSLTGNDSDNQIVGDDGNDLVFAAGGSDLISGGLGNDTIDGGSGDDLIISGPGSGTETTLGVQSEFLSWGAFGNQVPLGREMTQDTGEVRVDISYVNGPNGAANRTESDDRIYVGPGEPFDSLSSAHVARSGGADEPTELTINFTPNAGFDDEVRNVQFRISDIDENTHRDRLSIIAFDAEGNRVPVEFVLSADTDLEFFGDTVQSTATGGNSDEANSDSSVLIRIAGPVARIEIQYDNMLGGGQHVHISNVHFQAIPVADNDSLSGGDGNDTVFGGIGNDTLLGGIGDDSLFGDSGNDSIDGEAGNDTIFGGTGRDTLYGDAGNDLFTLATADVETVGGDTFTGAVESIFGGGGAGTAPFDNDTLDLQALYATYGWSRVILTPGVDPEDGVVRILDATNPNIVLATIYFDNIETIIRCFTPGTLILTDRGEVAVEALVAGDLVMTRDSGLQPLRWVGRQHFSQTALIADPDLQPVRIAAGALAGAGPARMMLVSPQHRVLVSGARAELLFGEEEVLVPAKHLIGEAEATRALPEAGVTYIHILFDRHEIVQSDGIWTESFQPAARMLTAMEAEVRDEILKIFPELATDTSAYDGARLSLKAHEARVLFAR